MVCGLCKYIIHTGLLPKLNAPLLCPCALTWPFFHPNNKHLLPQMEGGYLGTVCICHQIDGYMNAFTINSSTGTPAWSLLGMMVPWTMPEINRYSSLGKEQTHFIVYNPPPPMCRDGHFITTVLYSRSSRVQTNCIYIFSTFKCVLLLNILESLCIYYILSLSPWPVFALQMGWLVSSWLLSSLALKGNNIL